MAEISWPRRSYEAGVLLVPLDGDARAWVNACAAGALSGVTVSDEHLLSAPPGFEPKPFRVTGEGRVARRRVDQPIHDADVVVLLAHDLVTIDQAAVGEIGDAAHLAGKLLAAVVVSPGARWEEPGAHRAMTAIRESADNVVILKDGRFVSDFLQALRGGSREGARGEFAGGGLCS